MKKSILLLAGLLIFSNFLFSQDEGKPGIKFDKTSHDFGDIIEKQNATHTFSFTNTGTVPLKLTNVKASCGCTTPAWSREEIQPGEKGIVKATFRPRGYANKNFHKSITVTTNIQENGQPKRVFLHIKGHVLANNVVILQDTTIKISEYSHDFGKFKKGKKLKWSFKITNEGKDTLTIHDLQKFSNAIQLQLKNEKIAPGKSQTVKVIFDSKNFNGNIFIDYIKIITNIPISKTRKISADGIRLQGEIITE